MTTIDERDPEQDIPRSVPTGAEGVEYRKKHAREIANALYGLMKEEIAAHGGAEGYMRWVREYDEE